jgi:glucokinase
MHFLGVDIGGTKIDVGIVDENGVVLVEARVPTPASSGGEAVLTAAINLAAALRASCNATIAAVGVGAGGQVDAQNGVILSGTDLLPGWAGQRVAEHFSLRFDVPCYLENDVNALAIGEQRFGIAKNVGTSVFLALGTGVGGALVIDGKLRHGPHWSAGELGHLIIDCRDDARVDLGGHRGTLEAYASGHGLVTTWREITGDRREITGLEIAEEAVCDSGSPAILAVAQTGRYLGYGLLSIVNALDPDLIVIGGGLSSLGDLLLDPARNMLLERALPGPSHCPVVTATLGSHSSMIGAAAVAMEGIQ